METQRVCLLCRLKKDIGEFRVHGTRRYRVCFACEKIWPRRCRRCHETKDRAEFPPRGTRGEPSSRTCTACRYITDEEFRQRRLRAAARWHAKNREQTRKRNAARLLRCRSTLEGNLRSTASRIRSKCRRTRIPYDLTFDYLLALYRTQNGRCALSGTQFKFSVQVHPPDRLSVDRVEPKLGYVQGNVRLVTWHANVARWTLDDAELLALARAVIATAEANAGKAPSS